MERKANQRSIIQRNARDIRKQRRLQLAGHSIIHPEELAHNVVLWTPKYGTRKRGRRPRTYIDNLISDYECDTVDELRTMIMDREGWKTISRSGRVIARLK